jgi:hypothetical protein
MQEEAIFILIVPRDVVDGFSVGVPDCVLPADGSNKKSSSCDRQSKKAGFGFADLKGFAGRA